MRIRTIRRIPRPVYLLLIIVSAFCWYYHITPRDFTRGLTELILADRSEHKVSRPFIEEILPDPPHALGGWPQPLEDYPNSIRILRNSMFTVGYDKTRRNPAWVAYRYTRSGSGWPVERPDYFHPDLRTFPPVTYGTYTRSGYDRGHMAPHMGISSRNTDATRSTFAMTNITPQTPELNRGLWAQLERYAHEGFWEGGSPDLWIITGPIFAPRAQSEFLPTKIKVPIAFYKILMRFPRSTNTLECLAFIIPQEPKGQLEDYLVSIREIEELTRLDFNPLLPEDIQYAIESLAARNLWPPLHTRSTTR